MPASIAEIDRLLKDFRAFEEQHKAAWIANFKADFTKLAEGFWKVQGVALERLKHKPEFNIFRLLEIEHFEVKTHSVMLADLLDPNGSHGQGGLFLRAFLERIGLPEMAAKVTDDPLGRRQWLVWREHEYIDITVQSSAHRFLMFIENKVYAGEQPDQLARYRERLAGRADRHPHHCLVFLTPGGRDPETGDADHVLSYRKDIADWLEALRPSVEAPTVRTLLAQYIDTVRSL